MNHATRRLKFVSDKKPFSHGMTSDNNGNIWVTSVEHSAIFLLLKRSDYWSEDCTNENIDLFNIVKVISDSKKLLWPQGIL